MLKHTPKDHPDFPLLQDALRISQNFLSSINEESTPRRQSMTVKKGEVRGDRLQPINERIKPISQLELKKKRIDYSIKQSNFSWCKRFARVRRGVGAWCV